jgi:hypothetical protein
MGAHRIYKAPTPYNASELADLDYAQSFDVVYMAQPNHEPGKLARYGHTDWRWSAVSFAPTVGIPGSVAAVATTPNTDTPNSGAAYFPQQSSYVVTAVNEDIGQESRPSIAATATNDVTLKRNYTTITWAAVTGATYYRLYKRRNQGEYGYIGQTELLTFRDDNIIADLTDGILFARNPITGDGNRPGTVFFFDQRLGWACTENKSNGVWMSRSADFENMDVGRPVRADDAITFALVADKVNAVRQAVPMDNLVLMTSTGIFVVTGANDDYLSANPPPKSRRREEGGVSKLKAIVNKNVAFYQPTNGFGVHSFGYRFEENGQNSSDVSVFSPQLFNGKTITSWAYARKPHSVIWASLDDGTVVSFTWEQDQEVWGWTGPHDFGGFVNSVAAVAENGEHRVYMSITRTFDGVERHFIERMASAYIPDDPMYECYLDCSVSQGFAAPTTTVGGLFHLEGETVNVLADGEYVPGKVVSAGKITLDVPASIVTVGISFEGLMETLPVIYPYNGTNAGKKQSIGTTAIKIVRTRGLKVGRDEDHLFTLRPRLGELIGEPLDRNTGTFEASVEPVQSAEATLVVKQDKPFSWTVTSVFLEPAVGAD